MSREPNPSAVVEWLLASVEPFILKCASDYAWAYELDPKDLAQVGRYSAWRNARNFDPSYNVPFLTYCAKAIKGAMRREGAKFKGPMNRPLSTFFTETVFRVSLDQSDNQTELRRISGMPGGHRYAVLSSRRWESDSLLDAFKWEEITPRDAFDAALAREALTAAIATLKPTHQQVITLRYIEGLNLIEIADVMNRTHERIRQIETDALFALGWDAGVRRLRDTKPPKPTTRGKRPTLSRA